MIGDHRQPPKEWPHMDPTDEYTAALAKGNKLWNELVALESALDVRFRLEEIHRDAPADLRAIVLARVQSYAQTSKSQTEYHDWQERGEVRLDQ